jgi:hypothetical protein
MSETQMIIRRAMTMPFQFRCGLLDAEYSS